MHWQTSINPSPQKAPIMLQQKLIKNPMAIRAIKNKNIVKIIMTMTIVTMRKTTTKINPAIARATSSHKKCATAVMTAKKYRKNIVPTGNPVRKLIRLTVNLRKSPGINSGNKKISSSLVSGVGDRFCK